MLKVLATIAGCAGIVAGALGGYSYVTTTDRLAVRDITVEGAHPTRISELKVLSGVKAGDNLLALDLGDIRERIEGHPWVARATISRDLPHGLSIVVAERVPEIILDLDELYYVDAAGVPFKPLVVGDDYDFPVLVGLNRSDFERRPEWVKQAIGKALELLHSAEAQGALAESEVSEVVLDEDGYTLTTVDGDLVVRVGDGQFERKLKRLARVRSVGGTAHARRVDLRFNQRVVVAP